MEHKTIIFEEKYGVSIDDFEDAVAIDKFIEKRIGRPLEVNDGRSTFTMRGGNVFKVTNRTRDSLDSSIARSIEVMKAQGSRLMLSE